MFTCRFCEISKNASFTEHLWTTASVIMKRENLSPQSTSPIKLYQPEKNPTVGQVSEKDVQCFLCSVVCISNSGKINTLHFFEKNISNTPVTTKLIALTEEINSFEKCFRHKSFRVCRGQEDRE